MRDGSSTGVSRPASCRKEGRELKEAPHLPNGRTERAKERGNQVMCRTELRAQDTTGGFGGPVLSSFFKAQSTVESSVCLRDSQASGPSNSAPSSRASTCPGNEPGPHRPERRRAHGQVRRRSRVTRVRVPGSGEGPLGCLAQGALPAGVSSRPAASPAPPSPRPARHVPEVRGSLQKGPGQSWAAAASEAEAAGRPQGGRRPRGARRRPCGWPQHTSWGPSATRPAVLAV